MQRSSDDRQGRHFVVWLGLAAGAALGALAVAYLIHQRNPAHRMDRILRRCEDRIHNIQSSLAELESSLAAPGS